MFPQYCTVLQCLSCSCQVTFAGVKEYGSELFWEFNSPCTVLHYLCSLVLRDLQQAVKLLSLNSSLVQE